MARLIPSGLQLCPNCNAELPRNLSVCPRCGAGLSGLISSPPVMAATPTVVTGPTVYAAEPVAVVPRPAVNWGGLITALLVIALAVIAWRYGLLQSTIAALQRDTATIAQPLVKEPARPDINVPGAVPKLAPAQLGLLGFDYDPIDASVGKCSYRFTVQNTGGLPGVGSVRVKFLDSSGVTLDEETRLGLLVPAGEKKEFTGEKQLNRAQAARVAKVEAKLL